MNHLVTFFDKGIREGDAQDKATLGGKGASLLALCQAGLPVPPGFVIHTDCCRRALAADGVWPEGLEAAVRHALTRLETATGRRFGDMKNPLLVSVRSGAAVSMPGMMDTLLNCGLKPLADGANPVGFWQVYSQFLRQFGQTIANLPAEDFDRAKQALTAKRPIPPDDFSEADYEALAGRFAELYAERVGEPLPATPWETLTACIDAVFRSWLSERAIAYRKQNDIRGLSGTAVTVQAMFPSQRSGIVFTVNPNRHDDGTMIIESAYGLGEAVVSGDVKPDHFIVARETLAIRGRQLGDKTHSLRAFGDISRHAPDAPSLDDAQIQELARLALQVEAFPGVPIDLEWGWADGSFALLQWRAIRGLEIARDVELGRREEIARLQALAKDAPKVWVRHNLGETLPCPTPLTWDVVKHFMSGEGGFGRMYHDFGYRPSRTVCAEGFLELICGYPYVDADKAAGLFWDGMPLTYDIDAVRHDPGVMQAPPTKFDANRTDATFLLRLPGTIAAMIKSSRTMKRLRRSVAEEFESRVVPPYVDYVLRERRRDVTALSTGELLDELAARRQRVLVDFADESLKPGFFGGLACVRLEETLRQILGTGLGEQTTLELIGGLDGDLTLEQDQMLYEVAHGRVSLARFLEAYGHRAVAEMELASSRWREDPSYLDKIMALHRREGERSPMAMHEDNRRRRLAAEARLPALLAEHGAASLEEEVWREAREAQRLLPYRENGKHYLMLGYELIRGVLLELARRWDLDKDVFFLQLDELERFESERDALRELVDRRKIRWQALRRLDVSDVIDSRELDTLGRPPPCEATGELPGEAVSAGVFSGPARIVHDPRETRDLGSGYVLVCPSTDPAWTVLFMDAGGLVVERGGVLSHGAIVARDFGIPAVVCAHATRLITDGQWIKVDGNAGRVLVIDKPNGAVKPDGIA